MSEQKEDIRQFTTQAPDPLAERAEAAAAQERDDRLFQEAVADQRLDAKPAFARTGDAGNAHAGQEQLLQYLQYANDPTELQPVSSSLYQAAMRIMGTVPRNPERSVALRKLLEAKDAAVRAALPPE